MKAKNSQNRPWSDWFGRDDWNLLDTILASDSGSQDLYRILAEFLHQIVGSRHAPDQQKLGFQLSLAGPSEDCQNFVEWMEKNECFERWSQEFSRKRPLNLLLLISRTYDRYLNSGKQNMTEDPFSHAVEKAFQKILAQDDAATKLAFLLHLEGLLPQEIGALLGMNEQEVDFVVDSIKSTFQGERRSS